LQHYLARTLLPPSINSLQHFQSSSKPLQYPSPPADGGGFHLPTPISQHLPHLNHQQSPITTAQQCLPNHPSTHPDIPSIATYKHSPPFADNHNYLEASTITYQDLQIPHARTDQHHPLFTNFFYSLSAFSVTYKAQLPIQQHLRLFSILQHHLLLLTGV
jgi:hypothetical protein